MRYPYWFLVQNDSCPVRYLAKKQVPLTVLLVTAKKSQSIITWFIMTLDKNKTAQVVCMMSAWECQSRMHQCPPMQSLKLILVVNLLNQPFNF